MIVNGGGGGIRGLRPRYIGYIPRSQAAILLLFVGIDLAFFFALN